METKSVVAGAMVAAGLVAGLGLLGMQLGDGIQAFIDRDRVVTVKGLAEEQVEADHVTWVLSFRELGNDLQQVYSRLEADQEIVSRFLLDAGLATSEVNVGTPVVRDSQLEGERRDNRYIITQTLTVSSDKVPVVIDLMQRQRMLFKQGVTLSNDYSYMTNFSYTGLNSIKPRMIEAATKNARAAAVKFANDSGSKLGKLRSAYQGQFSISNRDENTPTIKNVRVVTTVEYYLKD